MEVADLQHNLYTFSILLLLNQLELFETLLSRSMDSELVSVLLLPYQSGKADLYTDSPAASELVLRVDSKVVQTASVEMLERVGQTASLASVDFQVPVAFAESAD